MFRRGGPPKVVIPNRYIDSEQNIYDSDFEEVEIAAHISLPQDGGWAWVVLFASFMSFVIIDGIVFTFGSLLQSISKDLKVEDSLIALVNSIATGVYLLFAPLASALINRFGFRVCGMLGSALCSTGLFCSYFARNFVTLLVFSGMVTGLGCSLINMSSGLVVGFYFEKLRGIAIAISSCGTSIGICVFFPLQGMLAKLNGWRTVMLLNSGIHGIIFFLVMAYRPLPSLIVTNADIAPEDRTRTVTYLPSLSTPGLRLNASTTKVTNVERLFGTMSNTNFPTAATVIDPSGAGATTPTYGQAGPSAAPPRPRISVSTKGLKQRQLRELQSIISKANMQNMVRNLDEDPVEAKEYKSCLGRLCHWESHRPESRPMYRDDAFYEGDVKNLPIYQKSVANLRPENQTGLEYQMAVSRALTANDLEDKRGICNTAFKRVLATMMDFKILKKHSFQLFCFHGFTFYIGFMVPYVFLKERSLLGGVPEFYSNYLVSVIGIASLFGKLGLSAIAMKMDPVLVTAISALVAGVSTVLSGLSYNVAYQYGYSVVFGIASSPVNCVRSIVLVKLYGLEKLTSSTGMYFLSVGFGNIISTPLAGILKNAFGYDIAFYVAGGCFILAGLAVLLMMIFERKEKKAEIDEISQKTVNVKPKSWFS